MASCSVALKEWAVICAALAAGRQAFIARKGGIHERSGGFLPEHSAFWLLPTRFHQQADELTSEGASLLEDIQKEASPDGQIRIHCYAVAEDALRITSDAQLARLAGQHIWSDAILRSRFAYREPGLWLLPVRVYVLPEAFEIANTPELAGCRSWVDLPEPLSTAGAQPALDSQSFARAVDALKDLL